MNYKIESFRNALVIFENDASYAHLWTDIQEALNGITDSDIIEKFNNNTRTNQKSISHAINVLIDERLVARGWSRQSAIFKDSDDRPSSSGHWWTLDFSKEKISVEVAFNHGEATAWNLLKPVLAGELNHVEKAIQTSAGIVITATDSMKLRGNFDGATGSYEKFLQYLKPLNNVLTIPMVIIGLEPPESFFINRETKQVADISDFSISSRYILDTIKDLMDSYDANYKTSSNITRTGIKISMAIKDVENHIAVLRETPINDRLAILNHEGWNFISLDSIYTENDLEQACTQIGAILSEN